MSTITVPSGIGRWPRAALSIVVALLVALAITIGLVLAQSGHAATPTPGKPISTQPAAGFAATGTVNSGPDNPANVNSLSRHSQLEACRIAQPCGKTTKH
jgi:hypothetical protein